MALTRKYYCEIAEIISNTMEELIGDTDGEIGAVIKCREVIAKGLATFFAKDNPRFSRSRFLRACEIER